MPSRRHPARTCIRGTSRLDGDVWELVPGKDFKGKPATFRASAVAQAARRNGKVRTQKIRTEDGDRIYLQFHSG